MPKQTLPKTLYQYASQQELMNVLDTRSIRLKSIDYIYSGKEFRHIVELGIEMFLERMDTNKRLYRMYNRNLRGAMFEAFSEHESSIRAYSCSFYEDGDHYSRWQLFGACGGYSVGFDRLLLNTVAERYVGKLARCVYDRIQQRCMITMLINKHEAMFEHITWKSINEATLNTKTACKAFYSDLALQASFIRNTFYRDEKEWRLTLVNTSSMKGLRTLFHAEDNSIVPHYILPLCNKYERLWLNDITVGPTIEGVAKGHDILSMAISKDVIPRMCGYSEIQLWELKNKRAGEYLARL